MKKIQIGIMGSAADLNYGNEAEKFAKKVGELLQFQPRKMEELQLE